MTSQNKPGRRTFFDVVAGPVAIGLPAGGFLGAMIGFLTKGNLVGGAIAGSALAVLVVAFLVWSDIHAGATGAPRRWPFQPGDEFMGWEVAGRLGTRADYTVGYDVRRDGERGLLTVMSTKHGKTQVAVRRDPHPLASVTSRHVVTPLDIGVVRDYAYVIVPMDRAEPLAALVERTGPLGGAALYRVAIGVALAVRDAHAQGVVLGQVRPDQVAVDGDRAALYGFDPLARFRDGEACPAPEQLPGSDVGTTRSDVFSLVSTIYFAATGRQPCAVDAGRVAGAPDWTIAEDWLRPVIVDGFADEPDWRPDAEVIVERLRRVGAEHGWQPSPPAPAYSPGLTRPSSVGRPAIAVAASIVLAALLPILVPPGSAVATEPASASESVRQPGTAATTATPAAATTGPSTVDTAAEPTVSTTVSTTGSTGGSGWPKDADDGSPAFRAYLGAALIVPDWISCAAGYCLVGSADQALLFTENPIDQVDQTTQNDDPHGALVGIGLRSEQADALLAR
jgi:hypothetical protein